MNYETNEGVHGDGLSAIRDRVVLDDRRRQSTHSSENLGAFTSKSAVRGPVVDQKGMLS